MGVSTWQHASSGMRAMQPCTSHLAPLRTWNRGRAAGELAKSRGGAGALLQPPEAKELAAQVLACWYHVPPHAGNLP